MISLGSVGNVRQSEGRADPGVTKRPAGPELATISLTREYRDDLPIQPDRGLFVPTAADPGVALAQASGYAHATIGWKELYPDDEPTTLSVLTRLAAQLPAEGILYLVSILQLVMRRHYGGDRAAYLHDQLDVAKELFPPNIFERVRLTAETTGSDTVIHSTQLLIAALLAVHFGKPGDRAQWDTAVGAELLLRIPDALDITGGQGDDSLLKLLIRRYGENRNEEERYLLGRYFDLFVQRPRAKWGHPSPFDRLVEADLVATPDWLRAHPQTRLNASSLALTNFEALGEKPLMRVPSGGILPLSMPLFLHRLSIGLYWNLFEAARKDDADHGVEDLNAKVGELFQEYCTAALAAAATAGGATFIPESEVRGPEGHSKPDALLLEDRSLILIEMTVSTLPRAVQVKGSVEGFRPLLAPEGPIGRKLRQPVTAATNLLDGTTHTPRLDTSQVDAIFPVVLFLHPLPQHAMVAREIAAAYTPPAALSTAGRSIPVHAVQFLSAEELEILEPMIAQGTHLADLITGKLASDPFLAGGPLKNYLFAQPGWREIDNQRMRTLLDDLGQACARTLGKPPA